MVKLKQNGPNQTQIEIGDLTLYFSYETCVAFHIAGAGYVVSENVWSKTTAKHLTEIDGGAKDRRIPNAEFQKRLAAIDAQIQYMDAIAQNAKYGG